MKNLILTGGFATMLLLGACGNDEDINTEDTSDQTAVTEAEKVEDVEVPEEETEETTETTEEANADEQESDVETLKETSPGETYQLENVNLTVDVAQINKLTADENLAMFVEGVEAGEEVNNLVIQYTVENTTEAPRDLFIDQAEIVTSTGQQIAPELLLADGITAMMQGAVSSTGTVPYLLEPGTGQEIEWVDVIVPAIMDDETYNVVSEEQKIRIEF